MVALLLELFRELGLEVEILLEFRLTKEPVFCKEGASTF